LTGGAITSTIADTIGTIFGKSSIKTLRLKFFIYIIFSNKQIKTGKPPDFIAFGITLIMTCILAMGASKSVIFNHSLNAINLAVWVFVMSAGLFYVDSSTWTEHQGFLPYGWSGVRK